MNQAELERYPHDQIPLSRAMGVQVVNISLNKVVLRAPLAPNINHRKTVFGGSANSVAVLAAWSLLNVRLSQAGLPSRILIQRSTMEYLLPIAGDFTAIAALDDNADWDRFTRMLRRKGRGRISLGTTLDFQGKPAAQFEGDFVAFGADE